MTEKGEQVEAVERQAEDDTAILESARCQKIFTLDARVRLLHGEGCDSLPRVSNGQQGIFESTYSIRIAGIAVRPHHHVLERRGLKRGHFLGLRPHDGPRGLVGSSLQRQTRFGLEHVPVFIDET